MTDYIDKNQAENGVGFIMIGAFYGAFAGGSLITNKMIGSVFNISLLTLTAASIGNVIVGLIMLIRGFILIKRKPIKNEKRLAQLDIVYSITLFICLILSIAGMNFQLWIVINIVMGVLILPLFITGIVLLVRGIQNLRKLGLQ